MCEVSCLYLKNKLHTVLSHGAEDQCGTNKSMLVLYTGSDMSIMKSCIEDTDTSQQTDGQVRRHDSPWHHQKQMQKHLHWGSTWTHMTKHTVSSLLKHTRNHACSILNIKFYQCANTVCVYSCLCFGSYPKRNDSRNAPNQCFNDK